MTPKQGSSIATDFVFTHQKLYDDAAWNSKPNGITSVTGLGVYVHVKKIGRAH
jgi:hypothetical protein